MRWFEASPSRATPKGQNLHLPYSIATRQTFLHISVLSRSGHNNAIQIKKTVYGGVHQLYLATGDHVQEYWWNGPNSGTSELIRISQNNITAFDKSNDGADQQVYTASGDLVYETWWRAGVSPTSSVLFKVAR